jgi:hypothetical protein
MIAIIPAVIHTTAWPLWSRNALFKDDITVFFIGFASLVRV